MKRKYAWIITCAVLCIAGMITSYHMGLSNVPDYIDARKEMITFMQKEHRTMDPDSIALDLAKRDAKMEDYRRSLREYYRVTSDSVLGIIAVNGEKARTVSIYEADTMGVSFARPKWLSVIPLMKGEQLLFSGFKWKEGRAASYYENARLIIVYVDDLNPDSRYSDTLAKVYLHELGHDYLFENGQYVGDVPAQHAWIGAMQSRLSAKFAKAEHDTYCSPLNEEIVGLPVELSLTENDQRPTPQKESITFPLLGLHEEVLTLV